MLTQKDFAIITKLDSGASSQQRADLLKEQPEQVVFVVIYSSVVNTITTSCDSQYY